MYIHLHYFIYSTSYTIHTLCTHYVHYIPYAHRGANPLGKPHKTNQKRDSREAIATPLRKHTTKQNEKSVQGWSGSKRKSSCLGQPLSYYRVLFLFLVETCKNSKEDNISAIIREMLAQTWAPLTPWSMWQLSFVVFLRHLEAHIMSSCSQDFRKESLRI